MGDVIRFPAKRQAGSVDDPTAVGYTEVMPATPTTTDTAEIVSVRTDPDGSHYRVTTRRGAQVIHHEKLTASEVDHLTADPTTAHVHAWSLALLRWRAGR
jgi:hypothetical protein